LTLVRPDLPGLEILDGDARPELQETEITGQDLQRLRWRRYEIESYLVHPASLERFVEAQIGPAEHSAQAKHDMRAYLETTFTARSCKHHSRDIRSLRRIWSSGRLGRR